MVGGLAGIEVIDRLAPVGRSDALVFEHREQAAALDVLGNLHAGGFKEGRCVVDVLNESFGSNAGFHHTGPTDQEGHGE